ncbi:MAG: hypothetical protein AAFZ63_11385 [Bacteroidota bacterium]
MKLQLISFTLLIVFALPNCGDSNITGETEEAPLEEEVAEAPPIELPADLLDGMYPPYDLATNSSVLDNAIFAWKEMIALSWKSTYTASVPQRETPDSDWSYSDGTPSAPLVWETFAHRVEYRPKGDVLTKPYDSTPSYPFVNTDQIDWNGLDQSQYFVMLDEDNEIGSCYVFANPNITSVTNQDNLVMYMAKANRVEYDYRKTYFNSTPALMAAIKKAEKNIPLLEEISTYEDASGSDPCGSKHYGAQGVIVLPCSDEASQTRGMMEIKTAWRPLTDSDNAKEFLVREAVTFSEVINGSDTSYVAQVDQYVLLGMHIIHKTNNYRHLFIATWEHNSLEDYGYKFALDNAGVAAQELQGVKRHNDSDGAHSRSMDTYGPISDAVQAQIKAANPDNPNFLANYRLTGFQSDVYVDETLANRKTSMPTYYLANLVIESDSTLADFSGSSIGNPHDQGNNLVAHGKFITTGGCVGCHGAGAQVNRGTDFSFLNDFAGKPIDVPDPYRLPEYKIAKISSDDFN